MNKNCKVVLMIGSIFIIGISVALAEEDDIYIGINSRNQIEAFLTNNIKGISVHAADGIFAVGRTYRQDDKELGVRLGWADSPYEENVPIIDLTLANYVYTWRIGILFPINVDMKERPVALTIAFKL